MKHSISGCPFCELVAKGSPVLLTFGEALLVRPRSPMGKDHHLVIAKEHYSLESLPVADTMYMGRLFQAAIASARYLRFDKYRIHLNGPGYAQVPHLHFHLFGG